MLHENWKFETCGTLHNLLFHIYYFHISKFQNKEGLDKLNQTEFAACCCLKTRILSRQTCSGVGGKGAGCWLNAAATEERNRGRWSHVTRVSSSWPTMGQLITVVSATVRLTLGYWHRNRSCEKLQSTEDETRCRRRGTRVFCLLTNYTRRSSLSKRLQHSRMHLTQPSQTCPSLGHSLGDQWATQYTVCHIVCSLSRSRLLLALMCTHCYLPVPRNILYHAILVENLLANLFIV